MNSFSLEIVTPDGVAFSGMAQSLLTHTDEGDVEILAGHADIIATVKTGRTRIITDNGEKRFASSSGGFIYVKSGKVRLVLTTFEFKENIDKARAQTAKERAEKMLEEAKSERDIEIARAKLYRALSRLNIANLK